MKSLQEHLNETPQGDFRDIDPKYWQDLVDE